MCQVFTRELIYEAVDIKKPTWTPRYWNCSRNKDKISTRLIFLDGKLNKSLNWNVFSFFVVFFQLTSIILRFQQELLVTRLSHVTFLLHYERQNTVQSFVWTDTAINTELYDIIIPPFLLFITEPELVLNAFRTLNMF